MLLRTLKFGLLCVFVLHSPANAVDLTIVSPESNDCVASQQGVIRGIAGQPIDVPQSDVIVAVDISNWEFFSTAISIRAHSCGDQPCQRDVSVMTGTEYVDDDGHPVYSNAVFARTISESDFLFSELEQRQFSFGYDNVLDGNVVFSVTPVSYTHLTLPTIYSV